MLTARDLGQHFHPVVSGANYHFETENGQKYAFSFFTGRRSNGVGYIKDGQIEFGMGRHNEFDDQKGLPDGTQDDHIYELNFSFGLFLQNEVNSDEY